MKLYRTCSALISVAALALLCSCSSSSPSAGTTNDAGLPVLTINNTLSWCTVTVAVGGTQIGQFTGANQSFPLVSGITVDINAVPLPSFLPAVWTGTTTQNGANATYVMTNAATQSVTVDCPQPG